MYTVHVHKSLNRRMLIKALKWISCLCSHIIKLLRCQRSPPLLILMASVVWSRLVPVYYYLWHAFCRYFSFINICGHLLRIQVHNSTNTDFVMFLISMDIWLGGSAQKWNPSKLVLNKNWLNSSMLMVDGETQGLWSV